MQDPKQASPETTKAKSLSETTLAKEVTAPTIEPAKSAGQMVVDSLTEPLRSLVVEKCAAGLPLRSAIECSRAQIAHDAAQAVSAKETTATAKTATAK